MHIHAPAAVVGMQLLDDICIEVEHGHITNISDSCQAQADYQASGTVIPGFVDIHSHGGGGYYFSDTNIENVRAARKIHRDHGTTSLVASLVTEPVGIIEEQVRRLAPLVDEGLFAGIHLEGPYLAEARCGAHEPALLRDPEINELGAIIDGAGDTISMVTLAPERNGGIEATGYLSTERALAAGASLITHFSNGMPKPADGDGTIASVALAHRHLPLEIILDGIHVNDETLNLVKSSGDDRIILITDAMSAAGAGDGRYTIGSLAVTVQDGIARLDSNGSLAGSTLTMDVAFRNYFESGSSLVECVHATATLPAKTLELNDVGSIAIGKRADLLDLSADFQVEIIEVSSQSHA
jgi:N-acetylglucosamine-6-phosphate deacetylase